MPALQGLLNAIRLNGKLYHMQMDWQDSKMLNTFLSYLKIKPHLRYLPSHPGPPLLT